MPGRLSKVNVLTTEVSILYEAALNCLKSESVNEEFYIFQRGAAS